MADSINRSQYPQYTENRDNNSDSFVSDALSKWEPYFGKLDEYQRGAQGYGFGNGELRADARARHETFNLPEAYKGKSRHLEDVLDFMRREDDEFYTRDLMPWEFTDDIHIQWQIFRFDRTLADIEPEQGIPRLVTAQTDSRSDHLIRRGLAFQLEHGFMTTEKGRRHFVMNLQQITDCVRTTAYFGVMHALLTGKNHYKEWRHKYGRTPKRLHNLHKYEKNMWAILQKDIKGLYIMDAQIKHDMKLNGVVPNVLVLPSRASIYAQMVPNSETVYQLRGPGAHDAIASGKMNTKFRGSKVFEAESFDVDFSHENVDLLTRPRMIGDYFVMGAGSIKIFSADHDKFKEIKFDEAKKYALNGNSSRFAGNLLKEKKQHFFATGDASEKLIRKLFGDKRMTIALQRKFNDEIAKSTEAGGDAVGDNANPNAVALLKLSHFTGVMPTTDNPGDTDKRELGGLYFKVKMEEDEWKADKKAAKITADPADPGAAANGNESKVGTEDMLKLIMGIKSDPFDTAFEALKGDVDKLVNGTAKAWSVGDMTNIINKLNAVEKLRNTYDKLHTAAEANVEDKKQLLIFRPFSTWMMGSAILAQGGRDLGSTWHGHHDFQLSDDVVRKTILGHYTFYSKSVIKRPKNYAIIEDCYASGYVSGGGVSFFTEESLREAIEEQKVGTDLCEHSLIAWYVRKNPEHEYEHALDLYGQLPGHVRDFESSSVAFQGAGYLRNLIEEVSPYREDREYLSDSPHINTIMFRGKQKAGGANEDENTEHKCAGKGHWGPKLTYDGCMAVREGRMVMAEHKGEH
tara:strand:- start:1692 stop:4094 length:2403 start_codon:yes stop_codon:yes gene_type:complete